MSTLRVPKVELTQFYSVKDVAVRLRLSERTVRSMVSSGRLVSYKIEGQRRISHEDVQAYLARSLDRR